jgi:hypothetical protein
MRAELVRVPLRYADTIVLLDCPAAMWLLDFGDFFEAYDLVHVLEMHHFDEGVMRGDFAALELIERCLNLSSLELIIGAKSVSIDIDMAGRTEPKELETIVTNLKLDNILECKLLRQVQLTGARSGVLVD